MLYFLNSTGTCCISADVSFKEVDLHFYFAILKQFSFITLADIFSHRLSSVKYSDPSALVHVKKGPKKKDNYNHHKSNYKDLYSLII